MTSRAASGMGRWGVIAFGVGVLFLLTLLLLDGVPASAPKAADGPAAEERSHSRPGVGGGAPPPAEGRPPDADVAREEPPGLTQHARPNAIEADVLASTLKTVEFELSAAKNGCEIAAARAGEGLDGYLEFLSAQLILEMRLAALESLRAGRARVVTGDEVGKPLFGADPYLSWTVSGASGLVNVAVPTPGEVVRQLRASEKAAAISRAQEVIDLHNSLSDEKRDEMKRVYTTGGSGWVVDGNARTRIDYLLRYAGNTNLLELRQ